MRPERWLGRLRYRLGGDQVVEDVRQGVSVFVQAFNVAASSHPSPLLGTPSTSKRRFNPPRNDSRVHRALRSSRGTLRTSCRLVSFLSFVSFPFRPLYFPSVGSVPRGPILSRRRLVTFVATLFCAARCSLFRRTSVALPTRRFGDATVPSAALQGAAARGVVAGDAEGLLWPSG